MEMIIYFLDIISLQWFMSLLNDTAIFATIVAEGSFSRAAAKLGLSNGLVSRRMATLEASLGVTLLKRTTRQFQLTPEGEMFWQHAKRIQQEFDTAISVIHSLADKPKGSLRVSAPPYFGRHYLMPMLKRFLENFDGIHIELIITDIFQDPIKENIDLIIRSAGYLEPNLKDSLLRSKWIYKSELKLYASPEYLIKHGAPTTPADLHQHAIVGYVPQDKPSSEEAWAYQHKNKEETLTLKTAFNCNDTDSRIYACKAGLGIAKFLELVHLNQSDKKSMQVVLPDYHWGENNFYLIYPNQQALPKRTRLLMDFLTAQTQLI